MCLSWGRLDNTTTRGAIETKVEKQESDTPSRRKATGVVRFLITLRLTKALPFVCVSQCSRFQQRCAKKRESKKREGNKNKNEVSLLNKRAEQHTLSESQNRGGVCV